MIIQQFKETTLAYSPDEIAKSINKYTLHTSYCKKNGIINKKADIIHFHNRFKKTTQLSVIQYHSEPFQVHLNYTGKKLVIAQYHATLPEYQNFQKVRNIVDFNSELYKIKNITKKIKIGYSPSILKSYGKWHNKGYPETSKILKNLKQKHNIDYDIITEVSLEECIKRKSNCNIIIDECVTSSYHRNGLEGVALGKMTICSLNDEVIKILKEVSGSNDIPFENIWIKDLEEKLSKIITTISINSIIEIGNKNREWMEKYWHPQNVINEYIKIYLNILQDNRK